MAKICAACSRKSESNDPGWCACGLDNAWVDDLGDAPLAPRSASSGGRLVRADALSTAEIQRIKTGTMFDTPLGGGVPRGACLLVWGRSGSGKTRLALQLCAAMKPAVFVSLEMPEEMTASYLVALGVPRESTWVTRERDWRSVALRARPKLVVVDSVSEYGFGAPAEMAAAYEWAHAHRVTVVCIAHATKDGNMKGSSELAHKADSALVVRARGRGRVTLHAPTKNRFAATGPLAPIGSGSI